MNIFLKDDCFSQSLLFRRCLSAFCLLPHRVMKFRFLRSNPDFASRRCRVVGLSGLEPPTSRLSGARSNQLSYKPMQLDSQVSHLLYPYATFRRIFRFLLASPSCVEVSLSAKSPRLCLPTLSGGGDDGIRTHDPLLAGQVLSQLSYTPESSFGVFNPNGPSKSNNDFLVFRFLVPFLLV